MNFNSPSFALVFVSLAVALAGCAASEDLGAHESDPSAHSAPDAGDAAAALGLRAFVTSASYKGDLVSAAGGAKDGAAAADSLCNGAAKGAGLTGTWVAYISSDADAAKDHVVDEGPFYAVDGKTRLYANKLGIAGGADVEIPDEKGGKPYDVFVGEDDFGHASASSGLASFWTGSTAVGEKASTCRSWTSSALSDKGDDATYLGSSTIVLPCSEEHHLLCLEQREAPPQRATKRVFVTSGAFKGNLGGLAGADAKCADAASQAGVDGTFLAWLSGKDDGKAVRAADRFDEARYVLLNDHVVFESKAQFTTGPAELIAITEYGTELDYLGAIDRHIWTGTLSSGTPSPSRCRDWTSAEHTDTGLVGNVEFDLAEWSSIDFADECNIGNHLYCFEK